MNHDEELPPEGQDEEITSAERQELARLAAPVWSDVYKLAVSLVSAMRYDHDDVASTLLGEAEEEDALYLVAYALADLAGHCLLAWECISPETARGWWPDLAAQQAREASGP